MIATNTPANFHRKKFSFQSWDNYDKSLFEEVRKKAEAAICEPKEEIWGCDISSEALDVSYENLTRQDFKRFVKLRKKDFLFQDPPVKEALAVFNPPYDLRITSSDIEEYTKKLEIHLNNIMEDLPLGLFHQICPHSST